MNQRRIIWTGVTLFIAVLFYALIPIDVYENHDILLSFLGGGLFAMALGQVIADFDSIHELLDKETFRDTTQWNRKYFALSIIPGFILIMVLVMHQSDRKKQELKLHGIVTKGVVVNGSSTTTTRRFRSNTTYDLIITYNDSSGKKHNIDYSASSYEFKDAYRGQQVDVVYSRLHPGLGTALLTLDRLAEYIPIADSQVAISDLIAILQSNRKDTILNFLNKISYQWTTDGDTYSNEKRNLAIKILTPQSEIAYIEPERFAGERSENSDSFEQSLISGGYKKKAITVGNQTQELYYSDIYTISKERKISSQESGFGMSLYTIYHVFVNVKN